MKKITTLVLFLFAATVMSFAQNSFQLSQKSVLVSGPANLLMKGYVRVTNTGSGSMTVKVNRTFADTLPGHTSYYCWQGACFPPETSLSPNSLLMNPQDSDSTLEADLQPSGIAGDSRVTYCFFDSDNPSDSACVTFNYNASPVGINELNALRFMSAPYPNPADQNASVIYHVQSGSEMKIVLSNMLGSKVKEINLVEKKSTVIIPTSDLRNGIYYCSIIIDGKISGTKKLIINHK
ncbi:MAG: T9SS C-terminal target domain-containing protein [Bacteroidetes bacterium]|nr:MAG: T9SS C-terminal target domain-containing protein [Bacteroidota bacterium]REK04887.1 MAG: T9SS C-terminal target domain-containing protein [Bacteroidota bacterium]REK36359.1 MAG: T9SS C-terminal target domain-containing protein [Bacteroidota bacterium]REK50975.1 MAG: T9SS C-terminal target domain-containing protein [Bacteroidota bacterium]